MIEYYLTNITNIASQTFLTAFKSSVFSKPVLTNFTEILKKAGFSVSESVTQDCSILGSSCNVEFEDNDISGLVEGEVGGDANLYYCQKDTIGSALFEFVNDTLFGACQQQTEIDNQSSPFNVWLVLGVAVGGMAMGIFFVGMVFYAKWKDSQSKNVQETNVSNSNSSALFGGKGGEKAPLLLMKSSNGLGAK